MNAFALYFAALKAETLARDGKTEKAARVWLELKAQLRAAALAER